MGQNMFLKKCAGLQTHKLQPALDPALTIIYLM